MKQKLWLTLIACLSYCIDKELYKAIDYLRAPCLLPKTNTQSNAGILKSRQRSQRTNISQSKAIVVCLGVYNQYDRRCQKENKQGGRDQNNNQYSHVVCLWFTSIYAVFLFKVNDLYHVIEIYF